MSNTILGLHHITAIAGNAQRNHAFYTQALGLRLVKKTVNFDDPGTYHFYFGNEQGTPGTILTFFPWEGIVPGKTGAGMATEISYAVPDGSLPFWTERFKQLKVKQGATSERLGEVILPFQDPDGLNLNLVVPKQPDNRTAWETADITASNALKGFHAVTLTLNNVKPTAAILTDIFGYVLLEQEGNRYRYVTNAVENAAIVDIVEIPNAPRGLNAGGTNHHVAFRVKDDNVLMEFREKIVRKGLNITPKINRDYFFSLYFREPGGVLFELATDNPGFTVDEPLNELGTHLKLPSQHEHLRATLERTLVKI
ncbi:glyoxalase family protein [Chitinophaga costaii]|uniref:Glyoxalase family protein n=1 Tax=Chitinophaga costaii TaxID=1335309 RepID=A0A1C4EN23_9BACT|nr:ring-cleaving dioxygenase [Chitinophaga costaii]PUZ22461.1 ring-cleaving dioxygenase [Chitinophaga costaii]SCC45066.1 glyoxalase family protein [Chitinophaga costaii]